jgi:acyl-CoA synthetase (NDP forming)
MPTTKENTLSKSFSSLLHPSSVAILGASDDPSRIGGRPLRYLREAGFQGAVYPVNPKYQTIQGVTSYPDIDAIKQPVDFALLALPAGVTLAAVEACAAKGVKAAVIFSSGFAEMGGEGERMQQRLSAIARESGMRIAGPNCLGVFNATARFFITFTSTLDQGFPEPGRLAVVSQSGAYGSHVYMLARKRGLKVNYWITTGNECDVHVAECLLWLADNADTDVIAVYAEGIRDGAMLREAFERARANGKPIVFMKVGHSAVGAQAAASHTASLAGSNAVYDAVFKQYGVHRAHSTEELLDIVYACGQGIYPAGDKLGLVTISGGVGVQMADAASEYGFDVAPMPEAAQQRLKQLLPFAATRNPVDITAQAFNNMTLIEQNMQLMLEQGGYDAILAFFTSVAGSKYLAPQVSAALNKARAQFRDRLMVLSIIAGEDIWRDYEANGYLVFEDPTRAIAAIRALCNFGKSFRGCSDVSDQAAMLMLSPAEQALPQQLDEFQAKRLLAEAGIPVLSERLVETPDAAADIATELGFPVVLKIVSPDIVHKTEIGGVVLNLDSANAVREAATAILERTRQARPAATITGLLIAPQIAGGVETILGVQRDPVFGPVVMFGLGGIFVEVFKDVTFRVAPFDASEARRMIGEIKGYALLEGVRGQPPADIDALAAALVQLSEFAVRHTATLESIDLNPFVVLPQGQGAVALDAVIVSR